MNVALDTLSFAARSHGRAGGSSRATPSDTLPEADAESKKPYRQILIEEISEGQHELERPPLGLFLSAVSAGLDIGFSLLLMAVVQTAATGYFSPPVVQLLSANMYAVGFLFVVLGRSELFTEHTTLAVLPLLGGKATVGSVGRLWGVVYAGNMLGAAAFAGLAVIIGPAIHVVEPKVLGDIARAVAGHAALPMFLSAVLAGWLMGIMSWLVTASRDTIGQIFFVWIIAAGIGLAQLHHSIVGSVEVLAGVFAGQGVTWGDFGHFLLFTTLGNAVGGTVFVALLKYSHATRGESDNPKAGAHA
jgi:formate/nitrite transporter FocA (FNT family)